MVGKEAEVSPAETTTNCISCRELAQLLAESVHNREQLNPDRLTAVISQAIQNIKQLHISRGKGKPYY